MTSVDVARRLDQWKGEATNRQHPNYYHADLDQPARTYAIISALVTKLRTQSDSFDQQDAVALFGALNSGQRMKNKVAGASPMPELREHLLAMLDGEGAPAARIAAADRAIQFAGPRMLGELYGWVHADTAPLYNDCATDALAYLGYDFSANDYEAFVAAHEKFKRVYQQHVGRLKTDLPLNLEIDKLYNVIDKVDLKQQDTRRRYWKIAPGPDASIWEQCRDGGYIAVGWAEMGDMTGQDRAGFEARRDEVLAQHRDATRQDLEQFWRFTQIRVGDRIVANRGISTVVGIGTVTGPYYYQLGERYGQRLPVRWDDCTPRPIEKGGWRKTLIELSQEEFERILQVPKPPDGASSPFSEESFRLLAELHKDPTHAFYTANKDALNTHVVGPFRKIMSSVRGRLPAPILQAMETDRRIFASILKQFTEQGCWDFYWGAFYPKGGRRTQDAQLSMWMDYRYLEYGFYIGAYGSEQRQRFQRNCQQYGRQLLAYFREQLPEGKVHFGGHENFDVAEDGTIQVQKTLNWEAFLRDPNAAINDVSVIVPRDGLLATPEDTLTAEIANAYVKLFPLVVMATEDDPLPAIARYQESIGLKVIDPTPPPAKSYNQETFLNRTCLEPAHAKDLYELLCEKKQIILYGPPGTGKTFVAQELAKWVTGLAEPPADRVEMIQFHPAYSYEDFIEGIRPESKSAGDGHFVVDYPPRAGVFRRFCESVPSNPDVKCVFIIDEINRGNIPRIFGELMLLLEYRERDVPLPYSEQRFRIPPNVYLIGTMNTADRSIALVDFALRRRFHFFHFHADSDLLERWLRLHPVEIPYLVRLYRELIAEFNHDPDYAIGPSHFMDEKLTEPKLQRIWQYSILPYLEEYFVEQQDRADRAKKWAWDGEMMQRIREEA